MERTRCNPQHRLSSDRASGPVHASSHELSVSRGTGTAAVVALPVAAFEKTVCTITIKTPSEAQLRALDTLAGQRLADPECLTELTRLYAQARSVATQCAIAGVLIRADYQVPARAELARSLREHRLKSSDGGDVIDALIRRLQSS